MKLYATTTSERASKGQGGNHYLDVKIKGQDLNGIPTRQDLFKIILEVEDGRLSAKLLDYTEGDEILLYPRTVREPKGEKQKGELLGKTLNKWDIPQE